MYIGEFFRLGCSTRIVYKVYKKLLIAEQREETKMLSKDAFLRKGTVKWCRMIGQLTGKF